MFTTEQLIAFGLLIYQYLEDEEDREDEDVLVSVLSSIQCLSEGNIFGALRHGGVAWRHLRPNNDFFDYLASWAHRYQSRISRLVGGQGISALFPAHEVRIQSDI